MCKLILGLQYKESPIVSKIIKSQIADLNRENDGCAGMAIGLDDKSYIEKRLTAYNEVYDFIIDNLDAVKMFGIHTRTKSTGSKTLENCHFYEFKNRIFAHNGIVSEFSGWNKKNGSFDFKKNTDDVRDFEDGYWMNGEYYNKDGKMVKENEIDTKESKEDKKSKEIVKIEKEDNSDKTDSRLFLENMPKEITRNSLTKYSFEKGFSGVAVLIEKDKKKAWLLAGRDVDVHTDFESFIMFYSYSPEDKIKNTKKFMGFDLVCDDDEKELTRYTMEKGIYEIDYSKIRI